jgi:hypothetical protein
MRSRFAPLLLLVSFWLTPDLYGQAPKPDDKRALNTSEKREQLLDMLSGRLTSESQRRDVEAKLGRMSPAEIDELFAFYTTQKRLVEEETLRRANQNLEQARAYRDYLQRIYQRQTMGQTYGGRTGFVPVITWLPEGTSLGASAVISPDRRYVRVTAQPFFSSIGNVDTFTFLRPSFPQSPRFYQPVPQTIPQPTPPRVETYYDGLRTRYRTVP